MIGIARSALALAALLGCATSAEAGGRAFTETPQDLAAPPEPVAPPPASADAAKAAPKVEEMPKPVAERAPRRRARTKVAAATSSARAAVASSSLPHVATLAKSPDMAPAVAGQPKTGRVPVANDPPPAPPVVARVPDPPNVRLGSAKDEPVPIEQTDGQSVAARVPDPPPPAGGREGGPVEKSTDGPAPRTAATEGPREAAAPTVAELVARHARENGIPLELAQAVVRIESRGNAHAANHGALGLMQIKPGTARSVGFSGSAAGLFSPEINLRYGMKVLGDAYRSAGGDTCRALAQYQSGSRVTHLSAANRAYCSRARSVMAGA